MMQNIKNFLVITVPTMLVLIFLLELFFRFVIPACTPPQNFFGENDLIFKFAPNQTGGIYSVGWAARHRAQWRINNHGWNSPIDYDTTKTRPRIAVIGDSYVEAMQVDFNKNYPALLGRDLFGSHDVYAFGISGAPLSQYLHISRYVTKFFNPDILIFNIVMNDFDESIYRISPVDYWLTLEITDERVRERQPIADPGQSQFNARKRFLKKSAIFRYFFFNLKFKQTLLKLRRSRKENKNDVFVDNTKLNRIERNIEDIYVAIDYTIGHIAHENPGRRIIFVLDAPRQKIYSGDTAEYALEPLRKMTYDTCLRHGIDLIDLKDPMTEDFKLHKIRFSSRHDNHWNEYGHKIVAREILDRILNH